MALGTLVLAVAASWLREPLQWGIRYLQVTTWRRRSLDQQIDPAALTTLTDRFASVVRAGRLDDAWALTPRTLQRQFNPSAFRDLIAVGPLFERTYSLVQATCRFAHDEGRFVSTLHLRPVGSNPDPAHEVCLVVVTQADQLRVDRIEFEASSPE